MTSVYILCFMETNSLCAQPSGCAQGLCAQGCAQGCAPGLCAQGCAYFCAQRRMVVRGGCAQGLCAGVVRKAGPHNLHKGCAPFIS